MAALNSKARMNAVGCSEYEIMGDPFAKGINVLPVMRPANKPTRHKKQKSIQKIIAIRSRMRNHVAGSDSELEIL
jgi:hypothetical protein